MHIVTSYYYMGSDLKIVYLQWQWIRKTFSPETN